MDCSFHQETPTQQYSCALKNVWKFSPFEPNTVFQAYSCVVVMSSREAKGPQVSPDRTSAYRTYYNWQLYRSALAQEL